MAQSANDDYGFSSSDEADLLALEQNISGPLKRSAADDINPPSKRPPLQSYPSAINALTKNFGMQAFRLKQEQVISRLLGGKSAAVVFPTGGGKSLCYQIPALVFSEEDIIAGTRAVGEHGITLVVSPLLALMKDQVDALVRRGVKAATLDSTKTREEYIQTCDALRSGELKLLYVAPERLNNEGFVEQMKFVRGGVRLLAVDEAHCISEWGHAFRPDYLKVSRFAEEINAERVVCLTATATPRVAVDICRAFNIDDSGLFRASTYRPNLHLLAQSGRTKKELYPMLYKFLKQNPGATIIYVTLQKQTEELASELREKGFNAKSFHAGLDTRLKISLQEEFMRRNDLIIVATIAFGMGIDKASIRNVVHFSIPSSLESYSQEIGRAGRDRKLSKCVFYVCGEDLHLREMFARGDLPSIGSIRGLLTEIFHSGNANLPIGGEMRFSHYSQEKDYDIRSTTLKNIYAQLELTHGLIRASTPVYTKYSFKPSPQYNDKIAFDKSPAAAALQKYVTKAKILMSIDLDVVCSKSQVPRAHLIRKLNDLNESGTIELKTSGVLNVYKVNAKLPRTGADIEKLVTSIHSVMAKREEEALDRTNQMLNLITSSTCFAKALAQHFGDDLPGGKSECGHCTWCQTHKVVEQMKPPPVPFNNKAFEAVLSRIPEHDDPRFLAKVAFGINTPRVTKLKLGKDPIFGSMDDHNFMALLDTFTSKCDPTD